MSRSTYQRLVRDHDRKEEQLQRARKLCERLQDQVEELRFRIRDTERGAREHREQVLALLDSIP